MCGLLPLGVMVRLGACGSLVALRWLSISLCGGWSYRMLERFCADGHRPLAMIAAELEAVPDGTLRAAALRAAAAALSPTAALHWATGITLFAGFVHVRSLDAELLQLQLGGR